MLSWYEYNNFGNEKKRKCTIRVVKEVFCSEEQKMEIFKYVIFTANCITDSIFSLVLKKYLKIQSYIVFR